MSSERDFQNVQNPELELSLDTYDIAGNVFRAYRNVTGELVFVVDETITDVKPNVTLIMNAVDNRKWDDVLANDYGVDLETIRPRRDNKYQKLDIEYDGLGVYDALINAYVAGGDVSVALGGLTRFRDMAGRRAATERLAAAEDAAARARETIARTDETIGELGARVKELRTQLAVHRRGVGREPTKKSAARILRTESQIDATNEKLARARKRLTNARRRLLVAEEDAAAARAVLIRDAGPDVGTDVAIMPPNDVVVSTPPPAPAVMPDAPLPAPVFTEYNPEQSEPKAEEMADEEVKPLFDKDPEILDEEIAFKPIDFGSDALIPASDNTPAPAPAPLSFVAPVSDVVDTEIDVRPAPAADAAPVLDTIISVDVPRSAPGIIPEPAAPVLSTDLPSDAMRPAPVVPSFATDAATPAGVAAAPVSSGMRPVSPVTGGGAPVAPAGGDGVRRPNLVYYVMLVVLIALSIFTLWLYQKNVGQNVPDLATTAPAIETVETDVVETPVVDTVSDTVTVPAPVVEPEPVPEPEPEPVVVPEPVPVAEPEPVVVPIAEPEPEPVPVVSPFLTPEPEPVPEPVVNKPAYNVSQNENMFVAAPEYDTETITGADVVTDDVPVVDMAGPTVNTVVPTPVPVVDVAPVIEPVPAPVPTPVPTYNATPSVNIVQPAPAADHMAVTSEVFGTSEQIVETKCSDGRAPDRNGCCAGEIFTDMEDGTFACCSTDGQECFPPM